MVDAYDAFLRHPSTVDRLVPEVVLRLGAMPTSKPVMQYLQRYASARQIVVDPGGWREPTGLASDVLHVDPHLLCVALAERLTDPADADWARTWLEINAVTRQAMERHLDGQAVSALDVFGRNAWVRWGAQGVRYQNARRLALDC